MVDMKLEVVVVPVSDVARAKDFYERLGWRVDADFAPKLVQLTPSGSGCSVQFGTDITAAAPGSLTGTYLIVSDLTAAREDLLAHGADVSEVFHDGEPAGRFQEATRAAGRGDGGSYWSFVSFSDPDGNEWLVQEITNRLPGRVEGDTTYSNASDLAAALRRAAAAHGEHEKRLGAADANWPDWYAEYMVKEQSGEELPA
jgi:catechol 2,3-dioxygenase-like lactoylglutathione lyase family enzyme